MRFALIGAVLAASVLGVAAQAAGPERRCGWLANPTPSNWWLNDRDGEWTLSEQGGYEAPGLDNLPDMSTAGWVETNSGGHGYGCACMTVVVNHRTHQVERLISAQALPLARCRSDRKLSKPD